MAVSLTQAQIRDRTKTVTRRTGWRTLRPGEQLTLCRRVMGRRPGELLDRITTVEVVSVRREPLNAVTPADVTAEGFPQMTPAEFVSFFCATHRGCTPETEVTRVAWRYLNLQTPACKSRQKQERKESPMTVSQRPAEAAAYFRARAEVKLAWGVDLHTSESGGLHESIADSDLIDPFVGRPDLDEIVGTEQHGPDFDGDLLVIRRTITWADHGIGKITTDKITPPIEAETAAVNAALDYLGYTGPREIRLLLTVDYA
jgi:hypothetical protein